MNQNKIIMLLVTCMFVSCQLQAGMWNSFIRLFRWEQDCSACKVNVLVTHDKPGVLLEIRGKYRLYDPNTNKHIGTRLLGNRKYIQALGSGIKWGEEFPGLHQLKIVPDDLHSAHSIDGADYPGILYVYDVGGSVSIVNELDLEDYIASVLSNQFRDHLPQELLAAITIVARTQAYFHIKTGKNPYWSIDGSISGYNGSVKNHSYHTIRNAVHETKGMILSRTGVYEGDLTPIPAEWGSGTGGSNQNNPAVFSRITLFQAEEMAKDGQHAAQILSKAFPGTQIVMIQ